MLIQAETLLSIITEAHWGSECNCYCSIYPLHWAGEETRNYSKELQEHSLKLEINHPKFPLQSTEKWYRPHKAVQDEHNFSKEPQAEPTLTGYWILYYFWFCQSCPWLKQKKCPLHSCLFKGQALLLKWASQNCTALRCNASWQNI